MSNDHHPRDALLDQALSARQHGELTQPPAEAWHQSRLLLWALLGLFIVVSLYALGLRTLVPPDEGRYAEIGREMFASGDWITTRLNGIKYFEKPPLQAWMNAVTYTVFGLGEWQARLWTGLCGIFGVLMTAWAGRVVFSPRIGWYAGLVLASSLYWLAAGQINSLDMSLAAMMTASLAGLLIAQRDTATAAERRNWMLLTWAAMALAVLAKGLVGIVLPGAVLVLYTLITRDWRIWQRLHIGQGLLLFFAVAAPWFVLVAQRNPEQPHFFFIHEHFERFLTPGHKREGAWYYFILLLLPGMLPWLALLPHSLLAGGRRQAGRFQPRLMLLIWVVFIMVFFSASSSKLPGYIVPVFPALALLTAVLLDTVSRRQQLVTAGVLCLVGALLVLSLPLVMPSVARHAAELEKMRAYQPWLLTAGCVLLLGGAAAYVMAWENRRQLSVLAIALSGFVATHLMLAGFEVFGRDRAGLDLLPAIQAELTPATKVYSVGVYEQSLTFYLRQPVILVDYRDEFTFGLEQEPQRALPRMDTFIVRWRQDALAGVADLAIVSPARYAEMQQGAVPMRVVAQDRRRIVISNQLQMTEGK